LISSYDIVNFLVITQRTQGEHFGTIYYYIKQFEN
jgi:hypothetical protein